MGYGLICRGSILGRGKRFFSFYSVKTGCGVNNPASYPIDIRENCPGREADHSPSSSAEVKNCGTIRPLPNTPSFKVLIE
jgi:hypothetical protein